MNFHILMMILAGTLLVVGCEKPKKTAVAVHRDELPPPLTSAQQRLNQLIGVVKPGLTEEEVIHVAGEPKTVQTTPRGKTAALWQYDLGDGKLFVVRFDKSNRVASADLNNTGRAQ